MKISKTPLRSRTHRSGRKRIAGRRLWMVFCCVLLIGSVGSPASARAVDPVPASAGGAGDWPQFRQGPAHTGYNPAETTISPGNVAGLGLAWQGPTGEYIASSPAVAGGVVYVGSEDGKLYAFAVGCSGGGGTCTPLWTGMTGAWSTSSPAVADGVVYVGSSDGAIYAFSVGCRSDGGLCTPLWTGTTGGTIASSPAVAGGVVYVGSDDGKLYAFAVGCSSGGGTCTPLWTGRTATTISYAWFASSPAVSDGVVYIGSSDRQLYAFATGCRSDGGLCPPLWTGTTGGAIESSPAVAGGVVYVGSDDGTLYAFSVGCGANGARCEPAWRGRTNAWIESSPAIADGVVYVVSGDGNLYAFGVGCSSGAGLCSPLLTEEVGAAVSSPAVANGIVYTGSGSLTAIKVGCGPVDGACAPLWRSVTGLSGISSPTIADGVVYAGSSEGRLYAFDLEHGDVTAPVITSAPRVGGAVPSKLGSGSTLISWEGSDGAGSGIVHYDLQSQRNGGAWVTVPSSDVPHVARSLKLGHSYRYRVRATDRAGNVGTWVVGKAVVPELVQGSSARVRYSKGTWHTQVIAKASGGSTRWSSSAQARATFTFTGRAVAWVTSTGTKHGRVNVYVDGVLRGEVDLRHDFKQWMRVLFSTSWGTRGTHTIQLRSSSPGLRIDVDAFVVYK